VLGERTSVGLDVHAPPVSAAAIDGLPAEVIETRPGRPHAGYSACTDVGSPSTRAKRSMGNVAIVRGPPLLLLTGGVS
jgi:hypothetical protein